MTHQGRSLVLDNALTGLRAGGQLVRWPVRVALGRNPRPDADALIEHQGLRAAIEARRRRPGTPILILSQYIERTYVRELLADSRGGVGYLLKDRVSDVRQFMADLSAVAAGGTVLDPQVVRAVFDRLSRTASEAQLTPREREVLGLMARGLSNSAIGEELDITERAVSKYVNRIFAKRDLPPGDNVHRRVLAVLQYLDDASA